jgi:hypothetical protein
MSRKAKSMEFSPVTLAYTRRANRSVHILSQRGKRSVIPADAPAAAVRLCSSASTVAS